MVSLSGRQASDASCTVKLPATSFPKDKIKVLLLENINQTAIDIFKSEGFQLVSTCPSHPPHFRLQTCMRSQPFSLLFGSLRPTRGPPSLLSCLVPLTGRRRVCSKMA